MESKANETQHDGDHYRSGYQCWDFIIDVRMGYFEGCATKYITRWRKKNGIDDLKKAAHYIEKLRERANVRWRSKMHTAEASFRVLDYARANGLTWREQSVIDRLSRWSTMYDLDECLRGIETLIAGARLAEFETTNKSKT